MQGRLSSYILEVVAMHSAMSLISFFLLGFDDVLTMLISSLPFLPVLIGDEKRNSLVEGSHDDVEVLGVAKVLRY